MAKYIKTRLPNFNRPDSYVYEVRRRHRDALLKAGAEPVLLYVPTDNIQGEYDTVRQAHSYESVRYELYKNIHEFDGYPLYSYGGDTGNYRVVSALVSFTNYTSSKASTETGFTETSNTRAWTLWEPVLPKRGAVLVRNIKDNDYSQHTMWVIQDVLTSTFPAQNKKDDFLLHQEFTIAPITSYAPYALPSVDDSTLKGTITVTNETKTQELSYYFSVEFTPQQNMVLSIQNTTTTNILECELDNTNMIHLQYNGAMLYTGSVYNKNKCKIEYGNGWFDLILDTEYIKRIYTNKTVTPVNVLSVTNTNQTPLICSIREMIPCLM